MKKTFDIELFNNRIEDYEDILSRFSNWKEYKREINLTQLLDDGKKIEFQVEIPNNHSVLYVSASDDFDVAITSLVNVCSVIQKMTFVIQNNKVLKLNVEINSQNALRIERINRILKDLDNDKFKFDPILDKAKSSTALTDKKIYIYMGFILGIFISIVFIFFRTAFLNSK